MHKLLPSMCEKIIGFFLVDSSALRKVCEEWSVVSSFIHVELLGKVSKSGIALESRVGIDLLTAVAVVGRKGCFRRICREWCVAVGCLGIEIHEVMEWIESGKRILRLTETSHLSICCESDCWFGHHLIIKAGRGHRHAACWGLRKRLRNRGLIISKMGWLCVRGFV